MCLVIIFVLKPKHNNEKIITCVTALSKARNSYRDSPSSNLLSIMNSQLLHGFYRSTDLSYTLCKLMGSFLSHAELRSKSWKSNFLFYYNGNFVSAKCVRVTSVLGT